MLTHRKRLTNHKALKHCAKRVDVLFLLCGQLDCASVKFKTVVTCDIILGSTPNEAGLRSASVKRRLSSLRRICCAWTRNELLSKIMLISHTCVGYLRASSWLSSWQRLRIGGALVLMAFCMASMIFTPQDAMTDLHMVVACHPKQNEVSMHQSLAASAMKAVLSLMMSLRALLNIALKHHLLRCKCSACFLTNSRKSVHVSLVYASAAQVAANNETLLNGQ